MRFAVPTPFETFFGEEFAQWSIRKRIFATLLPPIVCILAVTGYATYRISCHYLNLALARTSRTTAMAQAHELENLLANAREDLVFLAGEPITKEGLRHFLEFRSPGRGIRYRELAFQSDDTRRSLVFVKTREGVADVPAASAATLPSGPLAGPPAGNAPNGSVGISAVTGVIYPVVEAGGVSRSLALTVIRLTSPTLSPRGFLTLSLDAAALRDVLSLFNSPKSPLYAFPRTAEKRYSFFFDPYGWIIFQSENIEDGDRKLDTDTARTGLVGDLGKPGLEAAFRPASRHEKFWSMVVDVQQGKHGLFTVGDSLDSSGAVSRPRFLGYAPVRFFPDGKEPGQVIGGVAFWDTSLLTMAASFQQFDVLFIITFGTIILIAVLIFFLSRAITRPILRLASEVSDMQKEGRLHPLTLPAGDQETLALRDSINTMISSLLLQGRELRARDELLESDRLRQRVVFDEGPGEGAGMGIVGNGPAIGNLAALIRKAASVDADVLVVGETGTGKELTAEAIHRESTRAGGPFVSINCGALDENLLLDALFGHVKGAFSEARTDRKGAFLAADGGSLHLDEIGNASVKVQQSLLRALSVRRIRPLGSDEEIPFDCRVIAATNADLVESVRSGAFREDLYYRLKVITIHTPPLREHKEDIPPLAAYFLKEAARALKRDEVGLTRGALEKLVAHDWPGNVREIKHCITRAVALAEKDTLDAGDLRFDDQPILYSPESPSPAPLEARAPAQPAGPRESNGDARRLNARQQRAWPYILGRESINRAEYQDILGGDIPDRTAQYDLLDLVRKGLLKKVGRGPATQYFPVRNDIAQ